MALNNRLLETERILLENVMLCLFQYLHSSLTEFLALAGDRVLAETGNWFDPGHVFLQSSANNPLNCAGGRYFWLGFFSGIAGQRPKWNTENEEQKFFCKVLIFYFQNFIYQCAWVL